MPQKFPRAPLPAVSALFAPLAWQFGRPDLFDAYSAGVVFMQLAGVTSEAALLTDRMHVQRCVSAVAGNAQVPSTRCCFASSFKAAWG